MHTKVVAVRIAVTTTRLLLQIHQNFAKTHPPKEKTKYIMTSKSSVPKNHHVQLEQIEVPLTQKNRGPHYTRIHADRNDPTLHITTKVKNHQQPLFFQLIRFLQMQRAKQS